MKKLLSLLTAALLLLSSIPAMAEETPDVTLSTWANNLYEPETKVALPATVAWRADTTAAEVAGAQVRPNTIMVQVDAQLHVTTLAGEPISEDLEGFLLAHKNDVLTALYVESEEAAQALSAFCKEKDVQDVFVAADAANAAWVKLVCDENTGVLGMVDFTNAPVDTTRASLHSIVTTTNAAHAKIAVIPQTIADRASVDYLRGMLTTVWVEVDGTEKSILTALTNGVNGVVAANYADVYGCLSNFSDVTTLLRQTFIAGHRGMPSKYIENTIRSERGAINAGANVVECDILLSSDGEVFILHDEDAKRLFNRPDITDIQALTMAEIQALTYDMTDDTKENAPNSVLNSNNENRTKANRGDMVLEYDLSEDRIPTLREFLSALNDEDIIHFIEIKTNNPAIVAPFKAIVEEMDMADRVVVITFNDGYIYDAEGNRVYDENYDVMAEMEKVWPEMSLGYLGYDGYSCPDLDGMIAENGNVGAAVGALYAKLQPYNSTYNQFNAMMSRDVIRAGRHRGLTCWPWTYNTEALFASDYLFGIYSLTTNYSWWATNFPVEVVVADQTLTDGAVAFEVKAQDGHLLTDAELEQVACSLVQISGDTLVQREDGSVSVEGNGEALVMIRVDCVLDIDGYDLAADGVTDTHYAIYSNPFTLKAE